MKTPSSDLAIVLGGHNRAKPACRQLCAALREAMLAAACALASAFRRRVIWRAGTISHAERPSRRSSR
jgi:hypothetical protein